MNRVINMKRGRLEPDLRHLLARSYFFTDLWIETFWIDYEVRYFAASHKRRVIRCRVALRLWTDHHLHR